jgi:hypothetical protein
VTQTPATTTPEEFMSSAPTPVGGSSPWAARYAAELRRVILDYAARAPRTLQQHLGPSELGVPCDRQVAGKMAALPSTNHVADPWPSIVGTACHAYAEEAFSADNLRQGLMRWVTEQKVTPHPDHPGTADLYDAVERAVVDHKFLGESSMVKVRRNPPRHYVVQLLLYGLGYMKMGLPVRRVVLAAYPRTAASLDGLYVWERRMTNPDSYAGLQDITLENLTLLNEVYTDTARRRQYADAITSGQIGLMDVPACPDDDTCYFCPFYRPQSAHDGGPGCAGNRSVGGA